MSRTKQKSEMRHGPAKAIDAFFNSLANETTVTSFDNRAWCGLDISWWMKGIGFGHITIAYNKKEHTWTVDDEMLGPKEVARIIKRIAQPGECPVCTSASSAQKARSSRKTRKPKRVKR